MIDYRRIVNKLSLILLLLLVVCACDEKKHEDPDKVNWQRRTLEVMPKDSLVQGASYLSVYSQIYSMTEHVILDLTVTVSLRNTNLKDTIYIDKAEYFNTKGEPVRTYFDETIYIAPLETVEIVIDELDKHGGTGANFLFDWKIKPESNEPFFEAVMISTYGKQGLSFTTQGRRVN